MLCRGLDKIFWDYVAPFLYRQRALRELELLLDRVDSRADVKQPKRVWRFQYQLGEATFVPPLAWYSGELAKALPALRELHLHEWLPDYRLPDGLVADLVRGAKDLRVLDVDFPRGADWHACAALRGVEHLALGLKVQGPYAPEELKDAVREAIDLAVAMGASLRTVTLKIDCYMWRMSEDHEDAVREAMRRAFAVKLPGVEARLEAL